MKQFGISIPLLALAGCSSEPAPVPPAPPQVFKENAVEYILKTKRLEDGRMVFQLNRTYFVSSKASEPYIFSDTLPALGTEHVTAEEIDSEGDIHTVSKIVEKDYDVLFKVDSLRE